MKHQSFLLNYFKSLKIDELHAISDTLYCNFDNSYVSLTSFKQNVRNNSMRERNKSCLMKKLSDYSTVGTNSLSFVNIGTGSIPYCNSDDPISSSNSFLREGGILGTKMNQSGFSPKSSTKLKNFGSLKNFFNSPSGVQKLLQEKIKTFTIKKGPLEPKSSIVSKAKSTKSSSFVITYSPSREKCNSSSGDKLERRNRSVTKQDIFHRISRKDQLLLRSGRFKRISGRKTLKQDKRRVSGRKARTIQSPKMKLKVLKKSLSNSDVVDGVSRKTQAGNFFGRPLEEICDVTGLPPNSILILLQELLQRGPSEIGIFRKSANVRIVRELKEKLDKGEEIEYPAEIPISAVASLIKDFLRSLPDCLFCKGLYEEWLEVHSLSGLGEKISTILRLCSRIPTSHLALLMMFLYVLHKIAASADTNLMTPLNLAVCVGPSILSSSTLDFDYNSNVSGTIEFMIGNFLSIFGEDDHIALNDILLSRRIKSFVIKESIWKEVSCAHQFSTGRGNSVTKAASLFHSGSLTQNRKMSKINLSQDSGIYSCDDDDDIHDRYPSNFLKRVMSHPEGVENFVDDVTESYFSEDNFHRNNWMRRGTVIRKMPRRKKSPVALAISL